MPAFLAHAVRFYAPEPLAAQCLAWSSTFQRLAVARADNSVEIWSFVGAAPFLERVLLGTAESSVEALAWAGKHADRLFSTGLHGLVLEHDLDALTTKHSFAVTSGPAWCMAFNGVRNRIAVGTEEGYICLFEVSDEGLAYERVLDKQEGRILCLAWHPSGDTIVTGSSDTLRVWNVSTGHPVLRMTTGRSERARETTVWSVNYCCGTDDDTDNTIISGDSRGKTSFWNGDTGTLIDSYQTHRADVLTVAVDRSQRIAYSSGIDPLIMHFQPVASRKASRPCKWVKSLHRLANSHDVRAICCVSDRRVVSVGVDAQLVINDYPNRRLEKRPPLTHGQPVVVAKAARCVLLRYPQTLELWRLGATEATPGGTPQVVGGGGGALPLSREPVKLLSVSTKDGEPIRCCAVSASAHLIAYGTPTRTRIYRLSVDGAGRPSLGRVPRLPAKLALAQHMLLFTMISNDNVCNDDDASDRLLVATSDGGLQCAEVSGRGAVAIVFTVSAAELQLTAGVAHMAVNEKGTYCLLTDFRGSACVFDLVAERVHCRLPTYSAAPITAAAIHQERVVLAYADQHIVECHVKNGKYTAFGANLRLPDWWRQSRTPVRGIALDCVAGSGEDLIVLYDEQNVTTLERRATAADRDITVKKAKAAAGDTTAAAAAAAADAKLTVLRKYEYLVFFGALAEAEVVAVEVKPRTFEEKLPPTLKQKKFGAM